MMNFASLGKLQHPVLSSALTDSACLVQAQVALIRRGTTSICLTTALAEKGLLQTKHAQAYTSQLITSTRTMRPARLDNLTADQRLQQHTQL
eukprot:scaffold130627_cov51-Prasinocladus_malaysianus.AAC.2